MKKPLYLCKNVHVLCKNTHVYIHVVYACVFVCTARKHFLSLELPSALAHQPLCSLLLFFLDNGYLLLQSPMLHPPTLSNRYILDDLTSRFSNFLSTTSNSPNQSRLFSILSMLMILRLKSPIPSSSLELPAYIQLPNQNLHWGVKFSLRLLISKIKLLMSITMPAPNTCFFLIVPHLCEWIIISSKIGLETWTTSFPCLPSLYPLASLFSPCWKYTPNPTTSHQPHYSALSPGHQHLYPRLL